MEKTLKWQLYVSTYTLFFGLPLLLFPNQIIPYFSFDRTHEAWVRLVGMFLLGLCYLSTMVYRKRVTAVLLTSIIMRSFFAVTFVGVALAGYNPFFYVTAGIVGIGVIGSTLAYRSERATEERVLAKKVVGGK